MEPQIAAALPKHMTADRVLRLAMTAFRKAPDLGKCTAQSVGGAIITLSQMGLEIGVMGQAYLVAYWNNRAQQFECQGIPGWQGIVDLIARTGRATAWTGAVYPGDFFEYAKGDRPFITHRDGDRHGFGDLLHTYAVGRVNGAEWPNIDVWSAARLIAHRDKFNKVGDRHYSFNNWEMYARKVPLLQVAKYMPKSVELQRALELEGAAEAGVTIDLDTAASGDWGDAEPQQQAQADKDKATEQPPPAQAKPKGSKAQGQQQPKAAAEAPKQEQEEQGGDPFSFDEVMKSIAECTTEAECTEIADIVRTMSNAKNKAALSVMLENKLERIKNQGADDLKME
jgi:recombination protein RecT